MRRTIPIVPALAAGAACAQPCTPQWRAVAAGGPSTEVHALATWDRNGAGPVLVAGGGFFGVGDSIGQWDGNSWSSLSPGNHVNGDIWSLAVFDTDGSGPAPSSLIAGGSFTTIGGVAASRIASWDGVVWKPLAGGITQFQGLVRVYTLAQFGAELIAGGDFERAGTVPAEGIARWNGSQWSALPLGVSAPYALVEWQGLLYAGAMFGLPGGGITGVNRLIGKGWTPPGTNYPRYIVWSLGVYKGDLIAGGDFDENFGPGNHIARFDGTTWRPLGTGVSGRVSALANFDPDGAGPAPEYLIAGGQISMAGGVPVLGVAAWDGQQWSALSGNLSNAAKSLTVFKGQLVAGGPFGFAGGIPSPYLAFYGCPPCEPDCNGDGALTLADFGCFQTNFALGSAQADCNRDGLLQLSDFGCFQTKFALGCP